MGVYCACIARVLRYTTFTLKVSRAGGVARLNALWSMRSAHGALFNALCSMRSVQCALLTALCSLRSAHGALLNALNMPRATFLYHGLRFYATGCVTCHGLRDMPRASLREREKFNCRQDEWCEAHKHTATEKVFFKKTSAFP